MHFSQVPTAFHSKIEAGFAADRGLLRVELQGFIDTEVMCDHLRGLNEALTQGEPKGVLCDLRAITGYESAIPSMARAWLDDAQRAGVCQVAVVANSSVLRTAITVIASRSSLELRSFLTEACARAWLAGSGGKSMLEN